MKYLSEILTFLLLTCCLLIAGCGRNASSKDSKSIQKMIYSAHALFEAENYEDAISEFQLLKEELNIHKKVATNREFAKVNSYIGICYSNLDQYSKAVEYYTYAIFFNETSPSLYFARAEAYAGLGDDDARMRDMELAQKYGFDLDALVAKEEMNDEIIPDSFNDASTFDNIDYELGEKIKSLNELSYHLVNDDIGVSSSNDMRLVVDNIIVEKLITDPKIVNGVIEKLGSDANLFQLGDQIYKIEAKDIEGYLGDTIQLEFPIPLNLKDIMTSENAGVFYLSSQGPVFVSGILRNNLIVIETSHLSSWFPSVASNEKIIQDYILKKAQEKVDSATSELKKIGIKLMDDVLVRIGDKMGKDFNPALFSTTLEKSIEFEKVLSASAGKKPDEIAEDIHLFVAQKIFKLVPENSKVNVLKVFVDNVDTIKEVATKLGEASAADNYYAGIEILGKAMADKMPIAVKAKAVVATVQSGIDMWHDYDFRTAYHAYTKGTEPNFFGLKRGIDKGDWKQVTTTYDFTLIKMMKKKYPLVKGEERLLSLAKTEFETQIVKEKQIEIEKKRLGKIYTSWKDINDPERISSFNLDLRDAFQKGRGTLSDAEQFKLYMTKINRIESDFLKSGITVSIITSDGFLNPNIRAVLKGFVYGGSKGYIKAINEQRRNYAKKNGFKFVLEEEQEEIAVDSSVDYALRGNSLILEFYGDYIDSSHYDDHTAKLRIGGTRRKGDTAIRLDGSFSYTMKYGSDDDVIFETNEFYFDIDYDSKTHKLYGPIKGKEGIEMTQYGSSEYSSFSGSIEGNYDGSRFTGTWKIALPDDTVHNGTFKSN